MGVYLLAALGLIILLLAGDALVRGAVNTSLRLGVPALIVSLTVVAFGTSAPELLIAIQAVSEGAPGIALGNVVGSNTANVLMVLGIPALLAGLATRDHDTRRSYLVMLGVSVLFVAICFTAPLRALHGVLLLAVLTVVLFDQGRLALAHRRDNASEPGEDVEGADPDMPWSRILIFLALGLIGLPLGADLLVDNASVIARRLGVSDAVIGLTLIAIGTSLPELATTIVAAYRRQADVALGNVIGSNIFNLLAITGVASLIGAIPVAQSFLQIDLWVMLAASVVLWPIVFGRRDLTWVWGLAFTVLYVAYLWVVVMKGAGP